MAARAVQRSSSTPASLLCATTLQPAGADCRMTASAVKRSSTPASFLFHLKASKAASSASPEVRAVNVRSRCLTSRGSSMTHCGRGLSFFLLAFFRFAAGKEASPWRMM